MTKEELFKKNFPEYVTEKGVCLSPFWDLFSAGIECATYELNKGCIQTLTKENTELKEQLTKAKEILRSLYFIIQSRIDYKNNIGIADEMWRAEQALKKEVSE
jgi:hypothetical protein